MSDNSLKKGRFTIYSNRIGLFSNQTGNYLANAPDVVLNFPFKDTVLEAGMNKEDVGRDERFLHLEVDKRDIDTLEEPKVLTNFKYVDKNGEVALTANSDIELFDGDGKLKQNLVIKGNNLLTLFSLRERLSKQVKLIYIDPPYNTGGDENIFSYNNTFNHSSWLVFMKNRLEVARELLREDGFITIAIDHCELFYLGVIADEIFGRDNRLSIITVQHNPKGRNQAKFFSENSEFLLVYAKNKEKANFQQVAIDDEVKATFTERDEKGAYRWEPYIRARAVWSKQARPENWYPIYVSKDLKTITSTKIDDAYELYPTTNTGDFSWKNIKTTFDELNDSKSFKAEIVDGKVILYHKYYEQQVLKNVWIAKKYQSEFNGTNLLKGIIGKNDFSYPKSLYAVEDIIKIMSGDNDIVLDFFAGSGTTAHAVIEANKEQGYSRKFIVCEQLEEHIDVMMKRLTKVIDGSSFCYFELKKYNQSFLDRLMEVTSISDVKEVYSDMQKNAFLKFFFDKKEFEKDENFRSKTWEQRRNMLVDILDENQLYLNLLDMRDARYKVSNDEMALTERFYGVQEDAES